MVKFDFYFDYCDQAIQRTKANLEILDRRYQSYFLSHLILSRMLTFVLLMSFISLVYVITT